MCYRICSVTVIVLLFAAAALAGERTQKHPPQRSQANVLTESIIDINNLTTWVRSDGWYDPAVQRKWNGTYPKGTVGGIYCQGVVWGGLVRDGLSPELRVGGSSYLPGLIPGRILDDGFGNVIGPEDPTGLRVFRVRPDYLSADLRDDAANYFQKPSGAVTETDILQLRAQYAADWNEWPWQKGAPFLDRNGNGTYEPASDIPGIPRAHQTLWLVANDLDTTVAKLYGSPSIGIEMQLTLWAYQIPGALSEMIFERARLIYKGTASTPPGAHIDSMFVAQWSDPDIGNPWDDVAGCDTGLSLGYAYNAQSVDDLYEEMAGIPPPAMGFDFFQGPAVAGAPSDTAIVDFARRPGLRNLPMTTFTYFAQGSPRTDPPLGLYLGTLQWFNLMKGCEPQPEYPSCTPFQYPWGGETRFELSGDPVAATGDLDGFRVSPGDRRIILATGPFTMTRGDTQEIVVALLGGRGVNHLNSVTRLKENDRIAQMAYDRLFASLPPDVHCSTTFLNDAFTEIRVIADARGIGATSITSELHRYDTTLFSMTLLTDDGVHDDGVAGNNVFGNSFYVPPQERGLWLRLTVEYASAPELVWDHVLDEMPTRGPVSVVASSIVSDNFNNDGVVNPGENIRYTIAINNDAPWPIRELSLRTYPDPEDKRIVLPSLGPDASFAMAYDPNDPESYFSFNIPAICTDSVFMIALSMTDTVQNCWHDTLRFRVVPLGHPTYGNPTTHTAGPGDWSFDYFVVDPRLALHHTYEVQPVRLPTPPDSMGFLLRDLTEGDTLILDHEYPDGSSHNIPAVDGLKITRGAYWGVIGLRKDSTRWISPNPAWLRGSRFGQEYETAFNGGVATGAQLPTYLGHVVSVFDHARSFTVEVRFDAANPQKAYRLRRTGPANSYLIQTTQPYANLPFSVWDVSDPTAPRQLAIAWRDQNDNGVWDPPVGDDGVEVVFIYDDTYDPNGTQFAMPPAAIPDECTVGAKARIVYGLSLAVAEGHSLNESLGTLYIRPWLSPSTADRFRFNPKQGSIVSPLVHGEGWNLISLPVSVWNNRMNALFPSLPSRAFCYEGRYQMTDTLHCAHGYWLKFPQAGTAYLGGLSFECDTVEVSKNWNMIGSVSAPFAVSSITSVPPGLITSNFFWYDGIYKIADSISPGRGYWVKVRDQGKLILSLPGGGIAKTIRIVPDGETPPAPPGEPTVNKEFPQRFALEQNYPNPFNPMTVIRYQLPVASYVVLKMYNLLGQEVATLVNELQQPGNKSAEFHAEWLPSGVYFYRLQAGQFVETRKLVLLR